MRGLIRPCRHRLGPALHQRWVAHLCGGCLALRDHAGQAARLATGYDALLVSVLIEAQVGHVELAQAGACPLRGGRRAVVLAPDTPAAMAAGAIALAVTAGGLADKAADRDIPFGTRRLATLAAGRLEREGHRLAARTDLDPAPLLQAAADAGRAEGAADLDGLLVPAGAAGATAFAHTAAVAGCLSNDAALRRAGDAFGRLEHLLDAVEDRADDLRHGTFNPLAATSTSDQEARARAETLAREVRAGLDECAFTDRALVNALFGPELDHAVHRAFRPPKQHGSVIGAAAAVGAAALLLAGMAGPPPPPDPPPPPTGQWGYDSGAGPTGPVMPTPKGCCTDCACDCCEECACEACCDACGSC